MKLVQSFTEKIVNNLNQVIVGKKDATELMIINLLCQGHLLIEDVPGVGKTIMARSLAKSLGCTFNRIQFTPDMLPSDVTGVSIFNQGSREFEFRPGPIMAQVVLADEINRATPKTQAALLEAMEEKQTTVDGVTHKLPYPFLVLATQNPIEYEGTFPLPEAQLDRFLLRMRIGYADFDTEVQVLTLQQYDHPINSIGKVVDEKEVHEALDLVKDVYVDEKMKGYIVELTRETRKHPDVYLGASIRGSLSLFKASQARAAMRSRDFILPDDIKALATSCLAHRVILGPAARLQNHTSENIVEEILSSVPVPGGDMQAVSGA
jgi:MoxR-like ATPase